MIYHVIIVWVSSYSGTQPAACACSAFGLGERQLVRPSVRFYRCREYESVRKRSLALVCIRDGHVPIFSRAATQFRFLRGVIIGRDSGD